ncbi:MAG: Ig-like domain-containing protein, partial [Burkholderiaceae bacterium]|nr:Ig-like domain-containing protein [Burkholderiaceae bacterium]
QDGSLITEPIAAALGTAVNWLANAAVPSNEWSGELDSATPVNLSFVVRESEIASTVKAAGAQGAIIVAVRTTGAVDSLQAIGATILGRASTAGGTVTLLRTTQAGLKLITLQGSGAVTVRVTIAGDMDRDGDIDGADSAVWEAATAANEAGADLTGDGLANANDRQVLYANYGWRANMAPVALPDGPALKTHTDLATTRSVDGLAQDLEGDKLFWRVLGATHGSAKLVADGQTLLFTPEVGYAGEASITVQADDGYAAGAAIELSVDVSGAKLVAIHIGRLANLDLGNARYLSVIGDFEDAQGVRLTGDYLDYTSSDPSVITVDRQGLVQGVGKGTAIVQLSARGIEGVNVLTVDIDSRAPVLDGNGFEVDVYPRAITLPLMSQRQLKVTLPDHTNISAAAAGTRYFISDSSIAGITPDGLISAKAFGSAQLSVIHGGKQHDFVVRVQEPVLGTATVGERSGAAVRDAQGNLLLVAPGSLPAETSVSINARSLNDLGMPLPAPDVQNALAAVEIEIGDTAAALPVQLAVKVNDPINPATGLPEPLAAGTQVFFWRQGTIQNVDGTSHDTWWLIDNGVIGTDGMAHTSSPPYSGVTGSGVTLVTTSKVVNNETGEIKVAGALINWDAIWAQQALIAMAPTPFMSTAAIGIFASLAAPVYPIKYTLEGSYKTAVAASDFSADKITTTFADVPAISVYTPSITALEFDRETRKLKVSGNNFIPPDQAVENFKLRVWLAPRAEQVAEPTETGQAPDRGLIWQGFDATPAGDGSLEITLPQGVALPMHVVYVERIGMGSTGVGPSFTGFPSDSNPVQAWSLGYGDTLVTTAHSVNVLRSDPANGQLTPLAQVTQDEQGQPLNFYGRYTDQIAFSNDGALAFIAGTGSNIYVFDTQTLSVVHTLHVVGSAAPLTSLAVNDGWLYVTEGSSYGPTAGRLMRINVNPMDQNFLLEQQSVRFQANAPYGFQDMAVSNGSYLALTAPTQRNSVTQLSGSKQSGNIYILDLGKIERDGAVPSSALVALEAGNFPVTGRGSVPQYISAGLNEGEFLLSSAKDHSAGLIGFRAKLDGKGNLTGEVATTTPALTPRNSDSAWVQRKFQQNIQRAADTVIVEYRGTQYALVADYNFLFNDVHFNPDSNFGFGKQIGGKIGVIEDPFGEHGAPKFLGATTPIVGGAVEHLTLGADAKLYADVFLEDVISGTSRMHKSLFV